MQAMRSYHGNLTSTSGPTLSTSQHLSYIAEITYNVRAQGGKNVQMGTGHDVGTWVIGRRNSRTMWDSKSDGN